MVWYTRAIADGLISIKENIMNEAAYYEQSLQEMNEVYFSGIEEEV